MLTLPAGSAPVRGHRCLGARRRLRAGARGCGPRRRAAAGPWPRGADRRRRDRRAPRGAGRQRRRGGRRAGRRPRPTGPAARRRRRRGRRGGTPGTRRPAADQRSRAGGRRVSRCATGAGTGVGRRSRASVCPICQGIALLRTVRPETVDRLADLAGAVAATLREVAAQRRAGAHGRPVGGAAGRRPGGGAGGQDRRVDRHDPGHPRRRRRQQRTKETSGATTVGLDIGGTKIAGGVVDERRDVIARDAPRDRRRTDADRIAHEVGGRSSRELRHGRDVVAVGVGVRRASSTSRATCCSRPTWPGATSRSSSDLECARRLPGHRSRTTPTPPPGASSRFGAARDADDMVLVTVGTGLGGGDRRRRRGCCAAPSASAASSATCGWCPTASGAAAATAAAGSSTPPATALRAGGARRWSRPGTPLGGALSELCGGDASTAARARVTTRRAGRRPGRLELLADLGTWLGEGMPPRWRPSSTPAHRHRRRCRRGRRPAPRARPGPRSAGQLTGRGHRPECGDRRRRAWATTRA